MQIGYSPSKYPTSKHEEDTDHHMEPKFCGAGLGRFYLFLVRGCGYYGSDGIPDEWDSECAPGVR